MASIDQDAAPSSPQDEGTESEGFAAAFAERADNPAGDRLEAGAEPQGSAQEPADEAGSELTPSPEAAGVKGSGEATAFDPFAGMTPELRAYWERVQGSERSQRGRVGALTKKLNAVTAAAPSPAPAKAESGEQGSSGERSETAKTLDDKLTEIREGEYADVVGPMVEVVEALKAEIEHLKPSDKRETAVTDAEAEEVAQAYDALGERHPDYAEIANDEAFTVDWLSKQSPKVLALANSNDPEEVSLVLTLYKAQHGAAKQPGGDEGGQGSSAQDKRERQLRGSRQPTTRGGAAAGGVPNEFGAAFKARTKEHSA